MSKKITATAPRYTRDKEGNDKPFSSSSVRLNGAPMRLKLVGTLVKVPDRKEFPANDWNPNGSVVYSFGVDFNEAELQPLEAALEKMGAYNSGWEQRDPHNDGRIYFKMIPKPDFSAFNMISNIPITPLKMMHVDIDEDMDVTVTFVASGYYNRDDEKFGLALKVKEVYWGTEPVVPQKKRKQKREEDDIDVLLDNILDDSPPPKQVHSKASKKILSGSSN